MLFRAAITSFVASGCVALPRTCWGSACWGGLAVDVVAPAADRHVIAAGSNSRLQRTAFVCCEVLPATSRGFASILRLVAVCGILFGLGALFGPPLKRPPLYSALDFDDVSCGEGICHVSLVLLPRAT